MSYLGLDIFFRGEREREKEREREREREREGDERGGGLSFVRLSGAIRLFLLKTE